MASSPKPKSRYPIRSISLPCRSHPSTVEIEEELSKFKKLEALSTPTAERISNNKLSGLEDLCKRVQDLLNLPLTQKAIFCHQKESCVDDLQDGFMSLLDICGSARDLISQIKEHGRDIQSSLRRRKGASSIQSGIAKYTCFRKKIKKDAKQLIAGLKKMVNRAGPLEQLDQHATLVIRALREVEVASISILHSRLLFLCAPTSKPKSTRQSLVSRLLQKRAVACENQLENRNELQSLDVALLALGKSDSGEGDRIEAAQNILKSLEISIETIDNGLECLFRALIKARASLLSIVSTAL
ncbi:uncharacterized protein LOC127804328 [Diospyros lotus]|uniref:uncharacterized protein LOC127804328 n=1 Tax=Diospyros lotus TaxID=55363 RepID=UPI0022553C50|nr:uncharacterized protein LOC127804328 [Diospyros lotus]